MNTLIIALMLLMPMQQHKQAEQKMKATVTANGVVLNWTVSTPGANCAAPQTITYNLFQSTSSGGEGSTPINSTPLTTLTYTVTGLTPGTAYYWNMQAYELCSTTTIPSAVSNEVTATIPIPPSPPSVPVLQPPVVQ